MNKEYENAEKKKSKNSGFVWTPDVREMAEWEKTETCSHPKSDTLLFLAWQIMVITLINCILRQIQKARNVINPATSKKILALLLFC